MLYALRKLIAFVFLGGIFWLIYRDPEAIGSPVLMNTLGVLAFLFGVFWFAVPIAVVRSRIRRRVAQNRERYGKWKESLGDAGPQPLAKKPSRMEWTEDERVYHHEKGTLYVVPGVGLDAVAVRGVPGDVAFPGLRRNSRKIQRVHFYLSNKRVVFAGKALFRQFGLEEVGSVVVMPGGLSFHVSLDGKQTHLAFTFQNPLVVDDLIRYAKDK